MAETLLERWWRQPHFTCPRCDITSWNPRDLKELYCGRCHLFFAPPAVWPIDEPPMRHRAPRDEVGVHRARKRAEEALRPTRHDEEENSFPSFPSFSSDPSPAADPTPSSIDPGGGDSGGGGASGDW